MNDFASAVSEKKSTISPVRCSSNRSTTVLLGAIWSYWTSAGQGQGLLWAGGKFLDDLLWFTYFLRYTFFLTVRVCYFGNVNDMLSYVYLPSVMWSEQEAVSPSYLGGRSEEVRLADRSTPTQTVNEHGTHRVTIIIETLACIINIISGVSYPGLGSSIYGATNAIADQCILQV